MSDDTRMVRHPTGEVEELYKLNEAWHSTWTDRPCSPQFLACYKIPCDPEVQEWALCHYYLRKGWTRRP